MPYTVSGNARIWFETRGEGPPLALIHGGLLDSMESHRFWIAPGIADRLRDAGFRTVVYDRRFSGGKTIAPIDAYTWDIETEDLLAVLDATHAQPVHVIAGSNGISVAIRLAVNDPDRVRSLTLCWPTPPDNRQLRAAFHESRALVTRHGPSSYVDAARRPASGAQRHLVFAHLLGRDDCIAQELRQMSPNDAITILDRSEELLLAGDVVRGVFNEDLATLGKTDIPVAVLPADPEDRFHTRAIAEQLASSIPCATLISGTPVSPSPRFPDHLDDFTACVVAHLRTCQPKQEACNDQLRKS